jgi:hypothetical protein
MPRVVDGVGDSGEPVVVDEDLPGLAGWSGVPQAATLTNRTTSINRSTRAPYSRPPGRGPQPDLQRLDQIEAQLSSDVLTDEDLATALHEAGLPELARVIGRFARRGHLVPIARRGGQS